MKRIHFTESTTTDESDIEEHDKSLDQPFDAGQQTESTAVIDAGQQTESTAAVDAVSQTESTAAVDTEVQTEHTETKDTEAQTEESRTHDIRDFASRDEDCNAYSGSVAIETLDMHTIPQPIKIEPCRSGTL